MSHDAYWSTIAAVDPVLALTLAVIISRVLRTTLDEMADLRFNSPQLGRMATRTQYIAFTTYIMLVVCEASALAILAFGGDSLYLRILAFVYVVAAMCVLGMIGVYVGIIGDHARRFGIKLTGFTDD
jgi:hypothetical protein